VRRALGFAAALFLVTCGSSAGTSIVPSVTAGFTHTCSSTPEVRCWGNNRSGELGDGTKTQRLTPVPVQGVGAGFVVSGPGAFHTCAIANAGALLCWGAVGATDQPTPAPVGGYEGGTQAVATGNGFTCALEGGGLKCWGADFNGQVGDGNADDRRPRPDPVQVVGLSQGVEGVSAGLSHACAVLTGGTVRCWGWNVDGQVGPDECLDVCATPVEVPGLTGVQSVSAGGFHTCALSGGAVKCWGGNEEGQLGDGTTKARRRPVAVKGLSSGVRQISAGGLHTCALLGSGGVKCWGSNSFRELGDGTRKNRTAPVAVRGLSSGVEQIAAGGEHTCALLSGGGIKCWGGNRFGQLGNGKHTWDLEILPLGRGTVTMPGFRCTRSCFTEYAPGTKLTLHARAAKGWKFKGWGGACKGKRPRCTLRFTSDKSVKVNFKRS
jgi:alpha-tubulin suppressor-like RCC1 family protein